MFSAIRGKLAAGSDKTVRERLADNLFESGRGDLNSRSPHPQCGALNQARPRPAVLSDPQMLAHTGRPPHTAPDCPRPSGRRPGGLRPGQEAMPAGGTGPQHDGLHAPHAGPGRQAHLGEEGSQERSGRDPARSDASGSSLIPLLGICEYPGGVLTDTPAGFLGASRQFSAQEIALARADAGLLISC
jgi:hypothetical protein